MWYLQTGSLDDPIPIKQDVQVNQSWSKAEVRLPPQLFFGLLEKIQQVQRTQIGLSFNHLVEKGGLVQIAPGSGLVDG